MNNDKIYDTLVLGGASTKGFITLGALQYLYDNKYMENITTYVGTSSGSMISYLLIIGYTPIEILVNICKYNIIENIKADFHPENIFENRGITTFNHIYDTLEKLTIEKIGKLPTLNDLYTKHGKRFICSTYNITHNHIEYLSHETHPDMPCLIAIKLSSSLPFIFENFKYDGSYYIDGGFGDNFPLHKAEEHGNCILGIITYTTAQDEITDINSMTIPEYINKLLFIPINQYIKFKINKLNKPGDILQIDYPGKGKNTLFSVNYTPTDKLDMFSHGYQSGKLYFKD